MIKFFKSRLMRSLVPYFLLGVLLIAAFRIISEISFFTEHIANFFGIITPFLIGGVIAYILNVPANAIQKLFEKINNGFVRRKSRQLSIVTLLLIIAALVAVIISQVVPRVTASVNSLINDFDTHIETLEGWLDRVEDWNLPDFLPGSGDELIELITGATDGLEMGGIFSGILAGFGAAFGAIFTVALAMISSLYILIEKEKFTNFVKRLVSAFTTEQTNDTILKYSRKLNRNFHKYIEVQTIDGVILGSLMFGLLTIFGSDHALILALILGFVNYIPYFGSIFGTAFAVIVMAFTQGIPTAAVAAIFMFIVQQADGNFIQPRLMGGSFSLSPLLVIISVTIGMAYGGVLGMLVAVPIVAILKDLLDEVVASRELKKTAPPPPRDDDEESIMDRSIWH